MRTVEIAEISVDDRGCICVFPTLSNDEGFEHIYRTATGVRWNTNRRCLTSHRKDSSSHLGYFQRIVDAAAGEYGIELIANENTRWHAIEPNEREQIEHWLHTHAA